MAILRTVGIDNSNGYKKIYKPGDTVDGVLMLAGGTMTGALTLNGDPTSALHAATKQYVDAGDINGWLITQTGHGFSALDVLRHNGSAWVKAQADSETTTALGIVVSVPGANSFVLANNGVVTITSHGLTVGQYYFLSAATSGALDSTEPTGLNQASQPILYVIDANTLFLLPYRPSQAVSDAGGAGGGGGLISVGRFNAVGGEYIMSVDTLDLDADEFYFYQFNFNFQGIAALKEILGVFNDDTLSTDYTKQAPNGFTTDYSANDAKIDSGTFGTGAARAGCGNIFKIVVSSAGGSDKYPAYTCNITLGSQGTSFICLKNFGATNITKFSIRISAPSGSITFSAGSFLEVFKIKQ